MSCVCEGKKGLSWHQRREIPPCQYAKDLKKAQDAARYLKNPRRGPHRWVVGSSIHIPEYEEP